MRVPSFGDVLQKTGLFAFLVFAFAGGLLMVYGAYIWGMSPRVPNAITGEVAPVWILPVPSYVTGTQEHRLVSLAYATVISFLVFQGLSGLAWLVARPAAALRPIGTAKKPLLQGLCLSLLGAVLIVWALQQSFQHWMLVALFGANLIAVGCMGLHRAWILRR